MGIGMALHEETLMDHRLGRPMNHNFAQYDIPANADIRDIEVVFVEEQDQEVSPLGVKGLGEIGIVGTAAAVANAIFHATGTRVRRFPITLDKLDLTLERGRHAWGGLQFDTCERPRSTRSEQRAYLHRHARCSRLADHG